MVCQFVGAGIGGLLSYWMQEPIGMSAKLDTDPDLTVKYIIPDIALVCPNLHSRFYTSI